MSISREQLEEIVSPLWTTWPCGSWGKHETELDKVVDSLMDLYENACEHHTHPPAKRPTRKVSSVSLEYTEQDAKDVLEALHGEGRVVRASFEGDELKRVWSMFEDGISANWMDVMEIAILEVVPTNHRRMNP